MGRTFWILMGVLGAALILLIFNHDSGAVLGIPTGAFASLVALLCWAVFIGGGVFSVGNNWGSTLAQMAIWVLIFLGLMTGYVLYQLHFAPERPSLAGPTQEASMKRLQVAAEYAIWPLEDASHIALRPYSSAGRATDL